MEIFNTIIDCTNMPDAQDILKELDSDKDLLLTNVDYVEKKIEIQFIQPINQIKTVGVVPSEISDEIFEKYNDSDVNIDVADYLVTYENGVYGIVADISVEESPEEEEPKNKRLPLPLLIIVGTLTAILTAVLVVVKLFKSFNKK